MGMATRRYVLISPCRDEVDYVRRTLDTVAAQSVLPALWVVVDDGSTDGTSAVLDEYAAKLPYLRVVHRRDRGRRAVGPGVIEAFYAGLEGVDLEGFDYVCKLDLDLILPPSYFAGLMDRMEADPRIGTCSGKPYFFAPGTPEDRFTFPLTTSQGLISEKLGDENAVGASKFYRIRCFREIGGFVRQVMWDGIDGHRCRQLGWIAVSWDDPELRFVHLRPMGTSHKNWWTGRMRHGFGQYFMGTGPVYMFASAAYRMTRPPLVVGGLAMLHGYFKAMAERQPRYGDATFRKFVRSYQWASLLRGKKAATAALEKRQASLWRAHGDG